MSKIRKSAKGKCCTVRIPGYCNHNHDTVILAHRNGYGVGGKNPDYQGAYCCSNCHDIIDGRVYANEYSSDEIYLMFCDGVFETQEIMRKEGLIKISGEK